jgi:hypothetical protein
MSTPSQRIATAFYRLAARYSAWMLSASPMVESVLVHRSVATGEVDFGRSDIDMVLVITEEKACQGANLASLLQAVNRARFFNPALTHIDVYEPAGIVSYAQIDTFWASTERPTTMLLRGAPIQIPLLAIDPDHALSKFLLWVEWFFAVSVQQKNRRNLRKLSLECWNAYASAQRLIQEPCLTRHEMEAQAGRIEENLRIRQLEEPSYATRFVFELADKLHRSRLPALRKLDQPLIFEATTSPLCLRRRFVVVPRADSSLPPDAFVDGAMVCTPEILDLFVHVKNAFFYWILPSELLALGIQPPSVAEFVQSCRYYSHSRFLLHPGFSAPRPSVQSARLVLIQYAMDWISKCKLPPAVEETKIEAMMAAGAPTVADYYRLEYDRLWLDSRRIEESLREISGVAAAR